MVPSLEILSVVGTSEALSSNWINEVESRCPKLKTIFFTRKPGTKALGWSDVVMMQTMRNPTLLPCGHIADGETISGLRRCCPLDRAPFHPKDLLPVNPRITRLDRQSSAWVAQICDASRTELDEKAIYHLRCGSFYNMKTIKEWYGCSGDVVSRKNMSELISAVCRGCYHPFSERSLRLCFPGVITTASESGNFDSLEELSDYTSILE
eukprot:TRINITY_DN5873_c0_g2_i2.p2 TRINITY_DN5873_c0_g2~~TRINITY_DN5873_c0_g2_i2.p2  ORF type:complete len:209 (-),score=37.10 TRINITY_DN5873_c0_g2_i2:74-700(-)